MGIAGGGVFNTQLQRGLLASRAEEAQRENKVMRYKPHPNLVISPTHFLVLLGDGRFLNTNPADWELLAQETRVKEVGARMKTKKEREKKPMEKSKAEESVALTENLPETRLAHLLLQRSALRNRETELTQEINTLAHELGVGSGQTSTTPIATSIAANATKTQVVVRKARTTGARHRRYGRNRANGIMEALTRKFVANGPMSTTDAVRATLSEKFTEHKIRQNLTNMKLVGLLDFDEAKRVWSLKKGWDQTFTGKKVAAATSPNIVGVGA